MKKFTKYPSSMRKVTASSESITASTYYLDKMMQSSSNGRVRLPKEFRTISGDPTITWDAADEPRYNSVGPRRNDPEDYASFVAYMIDKVAGFPLYKFGGFSDQGGWLVDVDGDGELWSAGIEDGEFVPVDVEW